MWDWIPDIAAWAVAVVVAVVCHEVAHGLMAERYGDDTARRAGRITLNPIKHIDPVGTIIFPALLLALHSPLIFGSAKPVPVDFTRLKPLRLGMLMVALAGPLTNVLLAIVAALLLHIDKVVTPEQAPWVFELLYRSIMINCVLATFNMIPLMPLDGGRVVYALLTGKAKVIYGKIGRYGLLILIALLLVPTVLGYSTIQQMLLGPTLWLLEHIMWVTGNGQ